MRVDWNYYHRRIVKEHHFLMHYSTNFGIASLCPLSPPLIDRWQWFYLFRSNTGLRSEIPWIGSWEPLDENPPTLAEMVWDVCAVRMFFNNVDFNESCPDLREVSSRFNWGGRTIRFSERKLRSKLLSFVRYRPSVQVFLCRCVTMIMMASCLW